MKRLLTIIILNIIYYSNIYGQCFSEVYSTPIFFEIKKDFDSKKYGTIKSNTEFKINYVSKDDNGKPDTKGTLVAFKKNNKLEVYQIGDWIRFEKGEILGKYKFDSCGFCYHEEYYEKLDTVKTSEVSRS